MAENTDIYNMREVINDSMKQFIEEEDESTLELGLYGFISANLAKQATTTIRIASEMANEMFPSKARLESNIISHAISSGITNIYATPAHMDILFCIVEEDLNNLFTEQGDNVVIDNMCKIGIGDYEYHFDYPIIISRQILSNNKTVYTARYDMSDINDLSDVDNPYLPSPYIIKIGGYSYLCIATSLRQVEITDNYKKIISNNNIDNKTYLFSFENQLSNFCIYVTENGKTKKIKAIYEGTDVKDLEEYCWYSFVDSSTIRIKFDPDIYIPSTNTEVVTRVYTTHGSECNFTYLNNTLAVLEDTEDYSYMSIQIMVIPQSNSIDGKDKIDIDTLKRNISKQNSSRGNLTNTADLNNYFNSNNTDNLRLNCIKKVDNNIMRSYYGYILAKDASNNVIPTNTINIIADESKLDKSVTSNGDVYYILKHGCIIGYNSSDGYGKLITEPEMNNYEFLYTTPFKAVIDKSIPSMSYYMTTMNSLYKLYFKSINNDTPLQFICSTANWIRNPKSDTYSLNLDIMQNIDSKENIVTVDEDGNIVDTNMMVIAVCYKDGDVPYRYFKSNIKSFDSNLLSYSHTIEFNTDDIIDDFNNIKITNGYAYEQGTIQDGFFQKNTITHIYILCKFHDKDGNIVNYGRDNLDDIVPGLDEYSVTNVYDIVGGLNFFDDYSEIVSTIVNPVTSNGALSFKLSGMPVIKYSYAEDENKLIEFISIVKKEKELIDDALNILENQFTVDFKFYNTYGASKLISLNTDNTEILDRVNISINLVISLTKSFDTYTSEYIKRDIKNSIENLYREKDLHIPNEISNLIKNYNNSVNYIEFKGFNEYSTNYQHLYSINAESISDVPEFVNINQLDDGTPDITISLV